MIYSAILQYFSIRLNLCVDLPAKKLKRCNGFTDHGLGIQIFYLKVNINMRSLVNLDKQMAWYDSILCWYERVAESLYLRKINLRNFDM